MNKDGNRQSETGSAGGNIARSDEQNAALKLLSASAVRERCNRIMAAAERGETPWFAWHEDKLDACADYVVAIIRKRFPDLQVPIHSRRRHFEAGGIDRWGELVNRGQNENRGQSALSVAVLGNGEIDRGKGTLTPVLTPVSGAERARIGIDLTIPSVLLDAGAGAVWEYYDAVHKASFSRSEGLGVASFDMFVNGAFSADKSDPLRSDSEGLVLITADDIERVFQVDANNPLVGVEGRANLMRRLGEAARKSPDVFGAPARLGNLYDYLAARAVDGKIPATLLLETLLHALGPVWPGRLAIGGVDLGDCWHHPNAALDPADPTDGLVPFHKLTQWLSYSLLEPLADGGIEVTGLDDLTGLPEYRNGGLFLDFAVIVPRDPALVALALDVDHPAIVEWRALTVIGLDRIAARVRTLLGLDAARFPLARVLEGGTWTAGRKIAAQKRPGGAPPLNIVSDGTVF